MASWAEESDSAQLLVNSYYEKLRAVDPTHPLVIYNGKDWEDFIATYNKDDTSRPPRGHEEVAKTLALYYQDLKKACETLAP